MSDLYAALKGQSYSLAATVSGASNADAKQKGFKDVFDYIMSDSNHVRQTAFLGGLPDILSEKQRPILLDGMAREYAGLDGWMSYVDREGDK